MAKNSHERNIPDTSVKTQGNVYCNSCLSGDFDGVYDYEVTSAVNNFQSFMLLPVTGIADMPTIKATMASCGDTSRSASACDCATILTATTATTLKNNGYQVVGRYLTGTVGNGISKALTVSEIQIIFDAGLKFFPIYESNGTSNSYFTSSQGVYDATEAIAATVNLGIPDGSIIYFAVDYDALDSQVTSNVLPYFQAIKEYFHNYSSKRYQVGVYGARNICSRVCNSGYAINSFVGNMSTGFSGNLGYTMPTNWAFDQFATVTLGSGIGQIEIDKNAFSGSDAGVNHFIYIMDLIKQLEDTATNSPDVLLYGYPLQTAVLDFLRHVRYGTTVWDITLFQGIRMSFIEYVQTNNSNLYNELYNYIGEHALDALAYDSIIDLAHLAATTQGYSSSPLVPNFWTGWGGDLATAMANVTGLIQDSRDALNAATDVIGNSQYSFSLTDLNSDIDAIKLAELLLIQGSSLANSMVGYYQTVTIKNRKDYILKDIGFDGYVPTEELLTDTIRGLMVGVTGFTHPLGIGLTEKATYTIPDTDPHQLITPSEVVIQATCEAFAKFILSPDVFWEYGPL